MGLRLDTFPSGEKIFIDANVFLYSAFKHPLFGDNCRDFLIRVDNGEVKGYSSDFVINEVFHKLMVAELIKKFRVTAKQAVKLIKERPETIEELEIVWIEMKLIENSNIRILSADTLFPSFVEISRKYNLLATDAIHVATMKKNRIKNIATNDKDFERVDWIKLWKP